MKINPYMEDRKNKDTEEIFKKLKKTFFFKSLDGGQKEERYRRNISKNKKKYLLKILRWRADEDTDSEHDRNWLSPFSC